MPLFEENIQTGQHFKAYQGADTIFERFTFEDCTFENCDFASSTFRYCQLKHCQFENCDLSLVKLPGSLFEKTVFKDCRMPGINWCDADWGKHSLLHTDHVSFQKCLLDHSIFIGLCLNDTDFTESLVRHCDFEGANLIKASFHNCDLEMTRFVQSDLSEADFTGAKNYLINAAANTLHQTHFSLPEALSLLHSLDIILKD